MFQPLSDSAFLNDSEAEDDVDQLYSDSEAEDGPSTNAQKPVSTIRGRVRTLGQTLLPAQRLENMLQADGVIGNLTLSKEGLYVLSVATEEFLKRMVQAGQRHASADRRNLVNYRDMASTTHQYREFAFLQDTVPSPLPIAEAFRLRSEKERELFDVDPATAGVSTFTASSAPILPSVQHESISQTSKPKTKTRLTNGKSNGSSSFRGNVYPDITPDSVSIQQESLSEVVSRTGSADNAPAPDQDVNGHDVVRLMSDRPSYSRSQSGTVSVSDRDAAQVDSLSITPTPVPSRDSPADPPAPPAHQYSQPPPHSTPFLQDSAWPAQLAGPGQPSQLAGPASGFLQGPGAPFGRGEQNPGRTIYSQHLPPE